MAESLCKTITSRLGSIKLKFQFLEKRVEGAKTGAECDELKEELKRVELEMIELKKDFGPELFVKRLESEKFWEDYKKEIRELNDGLTIEELLNSAISVCSKKVWPRLKIMEKLFDDLVMPREADNLVRERAYERFCDGVLNSGIVEEKINEISRECIGSVQMVWSYINSLLLKKLSSEKVLVLNQIPGGRLGGCFGQFGEEINVSINTDPGVWLAYGMKSGRLEVNDGENRAGLVMQGGVLKLKTAGENLAEGATGGVVICDEASDRVGFGIDGATLYVKRAYEALGIRAHSGTILTEQYQSLGVDIDKNVNIYKYDQQERKYGYLHGNIAHGINNTSNKDLFNYFIIQGSGMLIIDGSYEIEDLTLGMTGGIMVIRKCPEGEIGKGMKDGMVILEDPNLTLQEAHRRISKDRSGGAIMMRVPDEQNPGNTVLVDVEDDLVEI